MEIKRFTSLKVEERRKLYDFLLDTRIFNHYRSVEEMCSYFGSIAFDGGNSHFSLWDEREPVCTLGVVSKDAPLKGEIFFISVHCRENLTDKLAVLLDQAFEYCSSFKNVRYILGISAYRAFLEPAVRRYRFTEAYQLLVLDYQGQPVYPELQDNSSFTPLTTENKKDFQQVHNEAFLHSPNGTIMEDEELDETLAEYAEKQDLAGVYYLDGNAAGMYMLKIKDKTGWIETIGVHPQFQGKGIGKILLKKSISLLQEQAGLEHIKLTVMSSNANAVKLYLNNGFSLEKIESTWYEKR